MSKITLEEKARVAKEITGQDWQVSDRRSVVYFQENIISLSQRGANTHYWMPDHDQHQWQLLVQWLADFNSSDRISPYGDVALSCVIISYIAKRDCDELELLALKLIDQEKVSL